MSVYTTYGNGVSTDFAVPMARTVSSVTVGGSATAFTQPLGLHMVRVASAPAAGASVVIDFANPPTDDGSGGGGGGGSYIRAEDSGASPAASAATNTSAITTALALGGTVTLTEPGTYNVTAFPTIPDNTALELGAGVTVTDGVSVSNIWRGPYVVAGQVPNVDNPAVPVAQPFVSLTNPEQNIVYQLVRGGANQNIKPGVYPNNSMGVGHVRTMNPSAKAIGLNVIASGQGLVVGDDTSVPSVDSSYEVYILASHSAVYGNGSVYSIGDANIFEFDAPGQNPYQGYGFRVDVALLNRGGGFGENVYLVGTGVAAGGAVYAYGRDLRFTLTDGNSWMIFGQYYRTGASTKITLPAGRGGVIVGNGGGASTIRNELDFGTDGLTRYRGTAMRPETNGVGRLGNNAAGWGALFLDYTNTAPGTTGNQTINKPSGRVNLATAATSVVVTNSLVTANSNIFATVCNNAAGVAVLRVVPATGSFTIHLTSAAPSETAVAFFVVGTD